MEEKIIENLNSCQHKQKYYLLRNTNPKPILHMIVFFETPTPSMHTFLHTFLRNPNPKSKKGAFLHTVPGTISFGVPTF